MATSASKLEFNPTSNAVTLLDPIQCSIVIIRRETLVQASIDGRFVHVIATDTGGSSHNLGSEEAAKSVWADIAVRDSSAILWVRETPDRWVRR